MSRLSLAYPAVWSGLGLGLVALLAPAAAAAQPAGGEALPWEERGQSGQSGQIDELTTPADSPPTGEPSASGSSSSADSSSSSADDAAAGDGELRWTDQGIGVGLGLAVGGRLTPGGLRITGSYLYRLSERDWFDGAAAFTIGSSAAECFRDRLDERVCDHGALDGFSADFAFAVRRSFAPKKSFAPFARIGAAVRFVRFGGDEVAGLAIPLIGGGGVAVELSPTMRLVASGQLELGGGLFSRGLGTGPQLGLAVGTSIEFALR